MELWAAGKDEALVVTEDIDSSNLAEIMVREFQDTSSIRTPTSLGHLIYIPGQLCLGQITIQDYMACLGSLHARQLDILHFITGQIIGPLLLVPGRPIVFWVTAGTGQDP